MNCSGASVPHFPSDPAHSGNHVPPAPWDLQGEAVCLMENWRRYRLLVSYSASPVGPYLENAVVILTWKGPHIAFMGVDSPPSVVGGRRNWGFPKVLQTLRLAGGLTVPARSSGVPGWDFATEKRQYRIRATCFAIPIALSFWCWQTHHDKIVRVPAAVKGRLRLGWRGKQAVVILEGFCLTVFEPVAP